MFLSEHVDRTDDGALSVTAYAADIDDYRTRYGKEEGERRFFAEHAPTVRPIARPPIFAALQAAYMQIRNSLPF